MKIAFFQQAWFENIGIMSLAAVLKKEGYAVEVFIPGGEKNIFASVKKYRPQIACFSCMSGEHLWALKIARQLKENLGVFTVFGGCHPTSSPDIIEYPQVDAVCRGEGEYPLLELVQSLERGSPVYGIQNLYTKKNGKIIRNDLRALIENLDELPFPSREIYDKYTDFQTRHFMASRGCSFSCSYCYNYTLRNIYGKKGKFVRSRSVGHIIEELKQAKTKYALRTVFFDDDVFILNKKWLYDFLERYKKEIGIPFICNIQARIMTDNIAERMKEAGCFRISMGIETGDENLRRSLLNKDISDRQIIDAARSLKKYGIKISTHNMMCLPDETVEQALKTIYLNIKIKPDYPSCSIFQPYPKTEIGQYVLARGLMKARGSPSFSSTFFKDSPIKQENIEELVNLQKFFYLVIKFPRLIPLINILIKLPFRPLYHLIFLLTYTYRYKKANRISLLETIQFGFRNLSLYTKRQRTANLDEIGQGVSVN